VQWEGTLAEAEAWVISTNLHRRQQTCLVSHCITYVNR
jgi:hypothetical protein